MTFSIEDTSRFLMQATLGADQNLLDAVHEVGPKSWLESQLAAAPKDLAPFETATRAIWDDFRKRLERAHGAAALNGDGNDPALVFKWYFHMAWWSHTLTRRDDLLRQRVAQALSEILVISDESSLELDSIGVASYYDLLYKHAFGSYSDLLYDVSMHPMMGIYLSHMGNQKANPAKNIHPDENYAREVMQLFTIGLFELNQDGTEKLNVNGQPIPTYDNQDIKELARAFTGLLPPAYEYHWETSYWEESYNGDPVDFDDGVEAEFKSIPFIDATQSMVVNERYHDRGAKSLLNGRLKLPGNQSGEDEIWSVVQQLVAHPSTAPFVAKHLINRLVTSNPSPDYVAKVSAAFGPRGDLGNAVRVLLSYPLENEVAVTRLPTARVSGNKVIQSQKLKSPLLRVTQILLAFKAQNKSGKMWLVGDDIRETLQMHPMSAPTVFNFYKADFAPHGDLQKQGLKAPEFELHTSATSVGYVNMMYYWFFDGYLPLVSTRIGEGKSQINTMELDPDTLWANEEDSLWFDLNEETAIAANTAQIDQMIDQMSILLTGQRDTAVRDRIKASFEQYADKPEWVVATVAFMIAISPEFAVQEA